MSVQYMPAYRSGASGRSGPAPGGPLRRLLVLLALLTSAVSMAPQAGFAETAVLTAPEAFRRLNAGNLVLIDVRSPQEWHGTGIPRGALPVTIHHSGGRAGFVAEIRRRVDPDMPVATICATGVRSDRAGNWLLAAGFRTVFNVREGMAGRWRLLEPFQPGWLRRGLPTEPWPD